MPSWQNLGAMAAPLLAKVIVAIFGALATVVMATVVAFIEMLMAPTTRVEIAAKVFPLASLPLSSTDM